MSLTSPIPKALRAEMEADPFYAKCCVTGIPKTQARIEWHHAFTWGGKRVNQKWCIVPLEQEIHRRVHEKWIAVIVERIILNRASEQTLRRYSKAVDLLKRRDQLNAQYGDQENSTVLQTIGF